MNYQIEFNGKKIEKGGCRTFREARSLLYEIVLECIEAYKLSQKNKKISPADEVRLQLRLMDMLTISYNLQPSKISYK